MINEIFVGLLEIMEKDEDKLSWETINQTPHVHTQFCKFLITFFSFDFENDLFFLV